MTVRPAPAARATLRRLAAVVDRVASDVRGVAAVEFALLLPVMLTLYIGAVEVTQALSADRKIVLLTRTIGDLTTQSSRVSPADLDAILNASTAVLAPLTASNAKIRLTSVAISGSGSTDPKVPNKASVCWSYQRNWTTWSTGTLLDTNMLPTALRGDTGTSLIMAEVKYSYKPVIGYVLTGTMDLSEKIFMRPRVSPYVERSDMANSGVPVGPAPCT